MHRAAVDEGALVWSDRSRGDSAMPTDRPSLAYLGVMGFVLLWNVLLAGQIARARRQAPHMLGVTALCGLLIAPAALIAVAAPTVATGRTVAWVTWMWPLTLLLFVVQAGLALRRRLVNSLISVPIFALNTVLLLAASARYASTWWPDIPDTWMAFNVAHAGALGVVWDRQALWSPFAIQLPLLAPAFPATWAASKALRGLLGLGAGLSALLTIVEYPPAARALATFPALAAEPLRERPRGDLALGVHVFPALTGPPPELALPRDLQVAEAIGAEVLAVTVTPSGATAAGLDSVARTLAGVRRDSMALLVSLGWDDTDTRRMTADPTAWRQGRLAMVDQVVRRLRPDLLFPVEDPLDAGEFRLGPRPLQLWTDLVTRAARLAHEVRPRTRVGVVVSAWTAQDSALYAWAARSADIDVLGFAVAPTFQGGGSVTARLNAAERWMAGQSKPHWIVGVRAFPFAFGERAQERMLTGTLSWASRMPRVQGVVVDGAGDYLALTGLQAANGRLRPAVPALAAANRALQETAVAMR
jgi:hypothetical protein